MDFFNINTFLYTTEQNEKICNELLNDSYVIKSVDNIQNQKVIKASINC